MTLDTDKTKRLVFIKYIYEKAVEQSYKPYPSSQMSVLMFHDAAELFLILIYEYLDIQSKIQGFMDYWNNIEQNTEIKVAYKKSMQKLNKSRNDLKHSAIPTHDFLVEEFRINSKNFFEENSSSILGVNFSELSLVDLVQYEDTKKSIKEAQKAIENGDLNKSRDKITIAFAQMIDEYENNIKNLYGRSPFLFGESVFMYSNSVTVGNRIYRPNEQLDMAINKLGRSVENFQDIVKIISLGIDPRKYIKFRLITPTFHRNNNGNYTKVKKSNSPAAIEEINFCLNFVIECAIILQEFDISE